MSGVVPGYYRRRADGRTVWVQGVVKHSETGEPLVVHAPHGAQAGEAVAEPLALFAGQDAPRWERVEEDRTRGRVVTGEG